MRALQERSARVAADFPLTFRSGDLLLKGQCLNISGSGLLATFDQDLELWTTGSLELQFADGLIDLHARVARVQGKQAGFAFQFRDSDGQEAVEAAVALARASMPACRGNNLPPF